MGNPFARSGYLPVQTPSGVAMAASVPGGNTGALPLNARDTLGVSGSISAGSYGDIVAGKASVTITAALIVLLCAWYLYTHNIQGGG